MRVCWIGELYYDSMPPMEGCVYAIGLMSGCG
jgi:hypothetical protein